MEKSQYLQNKLYVEIYKIRLNVPQGQHFINRRFQSTDKQ